MRLFISILLFLVLTPVTCVLSLTDGATRSLSDVDTVMQALDASKAREGVIDGAEEVLAREVERNPQLAGNVTRGELHVVADDVISKEWFDVTARKTYTTLLAQLEASPESGIVDLRPLKADLRIAIAELRQRAVDACGRLAGKMQCSPGQPAVKGIQEYVDKARVIVDNTADQVNLIDEVGRSEAERKDVRQALDRVHLVRWAGLLLIGTIVLLVALVNIGSWRRVLVTTGWVVGLAALVSLGVQYGAAGPMRSALETRVAAYREWREGDPVMDKIAPPVVARFTGEMVDRAAQKARVPLLIMTVFGAVLVAAGYAAGRREDA